jgi:hypothetical protein
VCLPAHFARPTRGATAAAAAGSPTRTAAMRAGHAAPARRRRGATAIAAAVLAGLLIASAPPAARAEPLDAAALQAAEPHILAAPAMRDVQADVSRLLASIQTVSTRVDEGINGMLARFDASAADVRGREAAMRLSLQRAEDGVLEMLHETDRVLAEHNAAWRWPLLALAAALLALLAGAAWTMCNPALSRRKGARSFV